MQIRLVIMNYIDIYMLKFSVKRLKHCNSDKSVNITESL